MPYLDTIMDEIEEMSMQEKFAPNSICFGCGPANEKGLKIKSYRNNEGLKMEFQTSEEHQAFPGIINGGIIGTLLDIGIGKYSPSSLKKLIQLKDRKYAGKMVSASGLYLMKVNYPKIHMIDYKTSTFF